MSAPTHERAPLALGAVDLGATSGRVMLGVVTAHEVQLHAAHRFENRPLQREGRLCWDIDALWAEVLAGLRAADELARSLRLEGLDGIGIDSWAVDHALVMPDAGPGQRLGEVVSYRDGRTEGVAERVAQQVPRERQFAATGIAQLPFITLYQLAAQDLDLPAGAQLLLVPDLLGFWLTGERRTELTNASTTGMLAADREDWVPELLEAAGLTPQHLAPLIRPGEQLGTVRPQLAEELGIGPVPVIAAPSHDTASAVLAVPAEDDGPVAYISSGTWSLIGLELPAPVVSEQAREAGFTNERGVDGTFRFLKNVSGMWLLSESIRQWEEEGAQVELEGLLDAAAHVPAHAFRIDPTDPAFLAPGRMADRVMAAARPLGDAEGRPSTPAQVVRCILESLAETYARELESACELAGVPRPPRLHVVGGGSRNALLNQLTADALGMDVVAGPVEATALGNVLVQARALGGVDAEPGSLREAVRARVRPERFRPAR